MYQFYFKEKHYIGDEDDLSEYTNTKLYTANSYEELINLLYKLFVISGEPDDFFGNIKFRANTGIYNIAGIYSDICKKILKEKFNLDMDNMEGVKNSYAGWNF